MSRTPITVLNDKIVGGITLSSDAPGYLEFRAKDNTIMFVMLRDYLFDGEGNYFDDSMLNEEGSIPDETGILNALMAMMRAAKLVMNDDIRHAELRLSYISAERILKEMGKEGF